MNQPDRMHGAAAGAGYREGRARYANAVYTYAPDFAGGDYKEGVVEEAADRVVFEFRTPYVIAATPPDATPWGIYNRGGKNGLVLRGAAACPVAVSVDRGRTWVDAGPFRDGLDLTDHVKGYRQYLLRLGAGAGALAGSGLSIRTVCQTSPTTIPRLKDGGTRVSFEATHRSVVSAGPTREQAKTHLVEGAWETPSVTLELTPPRKAAAATVYAAAHALSYNPPNPRTNYRIDYSADGGTTWTAVVADWKITRRGYEPEGGAVWSQSFSWGEAPVAGSAVRVRFSNDGRIGYLRAEAHLAYRTAGRDGTRVTFDWADDAGSHRAAHVFAATGAPAWDLETGKNVATRWVEYEAVAAK